MTEMSNTNAELAVIDLHIEELSQRIDDLKERMVAMTSQEYETKNQSMLLSTMLEVMKDLKLLRLEMLGAPHSAGMIAGACISQ